MKRHVLLLLIFISYPVFGETFSCSAELSNFGKPGVVETTTFSRSGNIFIGNNKYRKNARHQILYESKTDIVLYEISQGNDDVSLLISMINKKSMKYKQEFMDFAISPKTSKGVLVGDCIVSMGLEK